MSDSTKPIAATEPEGRRPAPRFELDDARALARERFGIDGEVTVLSSYIDRNFRLTEADGTSWVLKLANPVESEATLELQNAAMEQVAEREPGLTPRPRRSSSGRWIERVPDADGVEVMARLVTFVDGPLLADAERTGPATWRSMGSVLARVDRALEGFAHPAMHRPLRWDLARADWIVGESGVFADPHRRALVEGVQLAYLGHVRGALNSLPRGVIYNDCNDHNVVVDAADADEPRVVGAFDFGDVLHTARIFELAVAGAYAVFDQDAPLDVLAELVAGYEEVLPLEDAELDLIFPALCMRLAVSVTISARDAQRDPENPHVQLSEEPAWRALETLAAIDPRVASDALRRASGRAPRPRIGLSKKRVLDLREQRLGRALSLSYSDPLELVRGRGAYLFDKDGRAYLDCVNNVCHVGHCHPSVVAAGSAQMAELNTNTRYLHDGIVELGERLSGLLPDGLDVCFFVNSGSEANELALRLARTATGRHAMMAVETGYHGNTQALIDISSYKHDGPGGAGPPAWLHRIPCPDPYRGIHRADGCGSDDAALASAYAQYAADGFAKARELGTPIAAVIAEPLIGCGGQIVPPRGWLRTVFEHARGDGALAIADEVQIGLGRVGSAWWGFELDDAVPDIVTIGKPFGNGHPLAAVVTRRSIADAFANGMEYFNTFGGNPVSAAIGLAVLDVLEGEDLRSNAQRVGSLLVEGFRSMAERHDTIGDVRGEGLYLGVQLVRDRGTREAAPERLARAIEDARTSGVLLSSDGPEHDVLKIKPPLVFGEADAKLLLAVFERALANARP